ncbi:glycine zipper domain-containing protein [Paenibacillus radicis (ex Gao et al. 2016)]|uniref:Glycine zipper domain-containing protein n=1 Tax=Paenibacillus radicis (ex Gao et al. 2016) TaxID=1737354 RepID=A0A917M058_9BACL|nr:glycine zipper domain-containing protein [Paenibacillus radicis (ex Gao et al. 2016)]GGG67304.1 hypothetical protein GCM10010918_22380 [Paenibacillus radicis (ex Gao et al. 2016)]
MTQHDDRDRIDDKDETNTGEAVGTVGGGAVGAVVGSVLGPVGTIAGGIVGAALGNKAGENVDDADIDGDDERRED